MKIRWLYLLGFCLFSAQAAEARINPDALAALKQDRSVQAYSFVITGDNRDGDGVLKQILKQAAYYQPRFMIHTGDFVSQGYQREYLGFLSLLRRAAFPVLLAAGNHEIYNGGRKWFQRYIGPERFAFSYGPDRYIFLDNADGELRSDQLAWLENELQQSARYRFVVAHMPPRNLYWFHAFSTGAKEMMKLVERYKANYVLLGHMHIYDKMQHNGVNYVISGGAGGPLYRMPFYFSPEGGAYYHFVLLQISDRGIKERVVPITYREQP